MDKLNREMICGLARGIEGTEDQELGCDDCFGLVDRYAELTLAGEDPDEAMRLVAAHLGRCGNCREEFDALLEAIRATQLSGKESGNK